MKATCPKNPDHNTFITVAHVTQDWLVSEDGAFLEVHGNEGDIVHGPNPGNSWTCSVCGTEAEVTE
jgi:hypothetical protein